MIRMIRYGSVSTPIVFTSLPYSWLCHVYASRHAHNQPYLLQCACIRNECLDSPEHETRQVWIMILRATLLSYIRLATLPLHFTRHCPRVRYYLLAMSISPEVQCSCLPAYGFVLFDTWIEYVKYMHTLKSGAQTVQMWKCAYIASNTWCVLPYIQRDHTVTVHCRRGDSALTWANGYHLMYKESQWTVLKT